VRSGDDGADGGQVVVNQYADVLVDLEAQVREGLVKSGEVALQAGSGSHSVHLVGQQGTGKDGVGAI